MLTQDEYETLVASGVCSYCGGALPTNGSGLDRLDNHRGYEIDNVVPCCRWCNGWHWRSTNSLTGEEMRAVFALYRKRHGVPYVWPVVRAVTRTGRASTRLDLKQLKQSGIGRLVRKVLSPERLAELAELAQRRDARAEIEALQREPASRFPTMSG